MLEQQIMISVNVNPGNTLNMGIYVGDHVNVLAITNVF